MGRPFKCPYCGESRSVSKGVRKTKTLGDRKVRLCKACNRKFTPENQKQTGSEEAPERSDQKEGEQSRPEQIPEDEGPPLLDALDREWTS